MERTVAIVKPHVVQAGNTDKLVELLEQQGFYVNRRKEMAISRESAANYFDSRSGNPDFNDMLDSISSGLSVVLVLSKLDAVRALNTLAGPANVKVAKAQKPGTIRALFGDENRTGATAIEASATAQEAATGIEQFFPSGPVSTMPAKEYLLETVMPGLVEALTDMCLIKPADPYQWLQQWLASNRPRQGMAQYPAPVLSGHVVVADQYEGIHIIEEDQLFDSEWNFQRAKNPSSVFGIGQCTLPGLTRVAKSMFNDGYSNIFWVCLRDEPVLYLNDEPVALRAEDAVQDRAGYFPRDSRKLTAMEARLKRDVFALAGVNRGELGVYHNAGKAHELQQVKVQQLTTIEEAFEKVKADALTRQTAAENYPPPHPKLDLHTRVICRYGNTDNKMEASVEEANDDGSYQMRFKDGEVQKRQDSDLVWPDPPPPPEQIALMDLYRVPITDETEPSAADFDQVARVLAGVSFGSGTAVVFSSHTGVERATTGMVMASMLYHLQHGWQQSSICFIDKNRPNLKNGEFQSVLQLLNLVDNGLEMKALVDASLDECACPLLKELEKKPSRTLLLRYMYLILFAVYLRGNLGAIGANSFEQWLGPQLAIVKLMARVDKN